MEKPKAAKKVVTTFKRMLFGTMNERPYGAYIVGSNVTVTVKGESPRLSVTFQGTDERTGEEFSWTQVVVKKGRSPLKFQGDFYPFPVDFHGGMMSVADICLFSVDRSVGLHSPIFYEFPQTRYDYLLTLGDDIFTTYKEVEVRQRELVRV